MPAIRSIARQHADLLALEQQLPRERRAVQLLQRQDALCHAHAPELDRAAGDDRVLGDAHRLRLVVEAVVREADRARVDVERAVDVPRPLEVRVAAGEQVDAGAAEQPLGLRVGRLGQQDVVVRVRRAVEGAERRGRRRARVERRRERADLLEMVRLELRERPVARARAAPP